jgi:hypothetical protein
MKFPDVTPKLGDSWESCQGSSSAWLALSTAEAAPCSESRLDLAGPSALNAWFKQI